MKKGLLMVLVLALLALASTANAQVFGQGKAQLSFGLTQFTAHTADTLLIFFGTPNEVFQDQGMIGLGAEIRFGMSDRWAFTGGGFYGFGSNKGDFGSGGEVKQNFNTFGLRVGLDHTVNLSDETGLYMGPGFEFASSKSGLKDDFFYTPGIDEDNDRTTSLSLDGRVGVIHKLGDNFGLNGSMGKKWSYVKNTMTTDFFTGTNEDITLSRWLSSVNGWAGFVFIF